MVFRPWSLRYPTHQFRREMDRLLSDFLGNGGEGAWTSQASNRPAINAWETSDAMVVELEVPGVKSDQFDISVVGNELTITVERPDTAQERFRPGRPVSLRNPMAARKSLLRPPHREKSERVWTERGEKNA
jgi:HSP20 family molecular chaperone IbpA